MMWVNLPPAAVQRKNGAADRRYVENREPEGPVEPPQPARCVNCDRTRSEHTGNGLKCPGMRGRFYTRPEEIV